MRPRFPSFESSGDRTGVVQQITVFSPALGRRGDISVFASAGAPDRDLPLVVLLHGVYGSHWSWTRHGNADTIVERLVGEGVIGPCVIAMPSDGLFGVGSGYTDNGGEDAETWITHDVPDAVRMLYPGAGALGTSIAGLSMGGFGALALFARHPSSYSAAAAMSPLTSIAEIAQFTGHPEHSPAGSPEDAPLAELLAARGDSRTNVWIGCGREDALLSSTRALHRLLDDTGVPHLYEEAPGEHDWPYWSDQLPHVLRFFDRFSPPAL